MNNTIKEDALQIMRAAFDAVLPDAAVRRTLSGRQFDHPVTLFAIGKAGWRMARAAYDALGAAQVRQGVVITKYQHSEGPIGNLEIYEAAHPVPDENGVAAARRRHGYGAVSNLCGHSHPADFRRRLGAV